MMNFSTSVIFALALCGAHHVRAQPTTSNPASELRPIFQFFNKKADLIPVYTCWSRAEQKALEEAQTALNKAKIICEPNQTTDFQSEQKTRCFWDSEREQGTGDAIRTALDFVDVFYNLDASVQGGNANGVLCRKEGPRSYSSFEFAADGMPGSPIPLFCTVKKNDRNTIDIVMDTIAREGIWCDSANTEITQDDTKVASCYPRVVEVSWVKGIPYYRTPYRIGEFETIFNKIPSDLLNNYPCMSTRFEV